MPHYTKDQIKKRVFLTGQPQPGGFVHPGTLMRTARPLCETYKAQQQPTVTLDEIKQRIAAATEKVNALRATLKQRP